MPAPPSTCLPDLVIDAVAADLTRRLDSHAAGHCVRVDSVRPADARVLTTAVREALSDNVADVYVLVESGNEADGEISILAERAIELRNRKQRQLVLMVPVGAGASASSLDNSFERIDMAGLLKAAGNTLINELTDPDLRDGVWRVERELGRARPVEAWARYVASVVADPSWNTLGRELCQVGLVPDLGGDELVDRLQRNTRCVKAITRPQRAVASVDDRLDVAGVQDGQGRQQLVEFFTRPDVDLSDQTSWASALAVHPYAGTLTFEQWPLAERRSVELTQLRVDPFLKDDGKLRAGTQLKQDSSGDLPYAEAGESIPAKVKVTWKTVPAKTDAIDRWRLEALPPEDVRDPDTEPLAKQTVKGDKRRATVQIEIEEEDLVDGALLAVRLTGLDSAGQPVQLSDGTEATDESQQFAIRWEADILQSSGRRSSSSSLAQARLDAALEGQDDLVEDAPGWDEALSAFSVRLGGRRTVLLGVSPALAWLQRKLISDGGRVTSWRGRGRLGEVLDPHDIESATAQLPQALTERRRRLFARLSDRHPRDVIESLSWDEDLRSQVEDYCQAYKRALDAASTEETRNALLSLDTLTLDIATAGDDPISAVVVLPLHPIRLEWLNVHDATLTSWAGVLTGAGETKAQRRQLVDPALVRRVAPANLPFAVPGAAGAAFVYNREATLGTGIYLHTEEAEPGAAVQAVFDVLGIHRRDVATGIPPSTLGERIAAYRTVHPGQDALRLIAYNPGSGELLAQALNSSVLAPSKEAEDDDVATSAPRLEVVAYSRRPSFTDPVPALTELQQSVAARQARGARSYLKPPVGLSVRPDNRLSLDEAPAHIGILTDLAPVRTSSETTSPDNAAAFRNLLVPATTRRVAEDGSLVWHTAPALRPRNADGAADAVDAHRAYLGALAASLSRGGSTVGLAASVGPNERASLRAAHERSDWVLTLDRSLGADLYTDALAGPDNVQPYILDYAPDFLEGLGPRLTVTTTHRSEVERLLADAMIELGLAAVAESVRDVLANLQVVSGRLALRLLGRSSLATEAVSLAALMAYLRHHGKLDDTIIVPVDAHQEMFGDTGAQFGFRRCDVILVRATSRTLRMECVEVKSRQAATLPATLVDDIVDQLESTVEMLRETFFRTDPPRLDAELQRVRLGGILRYHADRALAMGLLGERRRGQVERLLERMEDGDVTPEISKRGYVVSLGAEAGFPRESRGVPIEVLTAGDLAPTTLSSSVRPICDAESTAEGGGEDPALEHNPNTTQAAEPPLDTDARESAPPHDRHQIPRDSDGSAEPTFVDVHLGQDAHAESVRWRISTAGSPHMFILGIPGQGKSVTTRRILNTFADQGLPALVVDFHGDMSAYPASGATVLDASQGLELSPFELRDDDHSRYAEAAWELSEVIGYVCRLGEIQRNVVYEAIRDLYQHHGFGSTDGPVSLPTMTELADAVVSLESAGRGRNVAARLRPLSDFGLFIEPQDDRGLAGLLRKGIVLDVHNLMEEVQRAASAFILRKVYREMFRWGQTDELRLAVVLDEAHRLARDVTLPKLMKEGRKYGVAVVVASQGIDDFHRDVLSNAGTKVAFRCNYPQSRTIGGFLRGRAGQDMSKALENLEVGQAYVSTPERAEARKVFMAKDSAEVDKG